MLFCLTLVTTTLVGIGHYASFYLGFRTIDLPFSFWELAVRGLWYSLSILAILGAHEFGHYSRAATTASMRRFPIFSRFRSC